MAIKTRERNACDEVNVFMAKTTAVEERRVGLFFFRHVRGRNIRNVNTIVHGFRTVFYSSRTCL